VSIITTRVTLQALNKSYRKERRKRCIFRRLRKTGKDDVVVTWRGRLVQVRAAATGKARHSTAVYGGPAVMWSTQIIGGFWSHDPQAGGVHQPDTLEPFVDTSVCENGHIELNLVRRFQPMKLIVRWSYSTAPMPKRGLCSMFISQLNHPKYATFLRTNHKAKFWA